MRGSRGQHSVGPAFAERLLRADFGKRSTDCRVILGLMRTRLLAVLLALTAVLPAAGPLWLMCQDGRLHSACCCEGEAEAQAAEARIEAPDCCVVADVDAAQPSPTACSDAFQVPPPVLLEQARVAFAAAVIEAPVPARVAERARGPPPSGPPLYVENCALLI